jgi:hypothetical protein
LKSSIASLLETEDLARDLQQLLAECGDLHRTTAAVKQLHAVGLLQETHLGGHRGLADMQQAGCSGEAAGTGYCIERSQLSQSHSFSEWIGPEKTI